MMSPELLKVSLRQRALYLPHVTPRQGGCLKGSTLAVVAELRELGFTLSEEALHAFDSLSDTGQQEVLCVVNEVMGTDLNWASLVKGWLVPTGETLWNHFVTFVANWMDSEMAAEGTRLPCGHLIPSGTFPLERYNGCPFCGTPFHTDNNIPKRVNYVGVYV